VEEHVSKHEGWHLAADEDATMLHASCAKYKYHVTKFVFKKMDCYWKNLLGKKKIFKHGIIRSRCGEHQAFICCICLYGVFNML